MISTTLAMTTTLFNYNGDGVRLKQVIAGVPTTYTQDLVAPLPVVLQAKTGVVATQYLFSLGTRPIAQYTSSAFQYLLPDALGSVRQIADASGNVLLSESYEPYGKLLNSNGSASSIFSYAGEQIDSYIKLLFLRSRYYSPDTARFLSKDSWQGDYTRPQSLNAWMYVEGDPVDATDPSGYLAQGEEGSADAIRADLLSYAIIIPKDYGMGPNYTGAGQCGTRWYEGSWKTLDELRWTKKAITDIASTMGNLQKFKSAMRDSVTLSRIGITKDPFPIIGSIRAFAPPFPQILGDVDLPDYIFSNGESYAEYGIDHELGHVWDRRTNLQLSQGMLTDKNIHTEKCYTLGYNGQTYCVFDITAGSEPPTGDHPVNSLKDWSKEYAATNAMEDWAESFASVVYPTYYAGGQPLGPNRRQYVQDQIKAIP